jgi:integrase
MAGYGQIRPKCTKKCTGFDPLQTKQGDAKCTKKSPPALVCPTDCPISMPSSAKNWDAPMKRSLKLEHGFGLRVSASGEKTKFGLRATGDGSGTFVLLPLKYAPSNAQAIQAAINNLLATMREHGVTLHEAHRRLFPDGTVTPEKKEALVRGISYVEWKSVAEEFLASRSGNRKTTQQDLAGRVANVLQTLKTKPMPRDGTSLMQAYAAQHFGNCPEGGVGRKRHLGDVAALLRFAVKDHGAPLVWMPPEGTARDKFIGEADTAHDLLTVPIKPNQLAGLLDALEADGRPDLRLAVALVGLFGLRPAELAVLKVNGNKLEVGSGVKRNPKTKNKKRKPRPVIGLDIADREGEAMAALRLFESGLVELPEAIRTQTAKCIGPSGEVIDTLKPVGDAFRQLLDRYPFWQSLVAATEGLTPYSLRHGYAWRAHMCGDRPMSTRTAAALMGHDTKTHNKHYGSWIDEEGIEAELARWAGSRLPQIRSTYRHTKPS